MRVMTGLRGWWFWARLAVTGWLACGAWHKPKWLRRPLYVLYRLLQGARFVRTGDTMGSISEPGLEIEFGGACPIQGDGIIDGYPCYYRSRGEGWEFCVALEPDGYPLLFEAWDHYERPYIWPQGGWVTPEVSERCIRKAAALWRAGRKP